MSLHHESNRSAQVILLAHTVVVLTFAQAGATKVKTQYAEARILKRPCNTKDHFVVHRSSIKRMRVAHNNTMRSRTIRFFDYCLYAASGTFNKYIASQVSHFFPFNADPSMRSSRRRVSLQCDSIGFQRSTL